MADTGIAYGPNFYAGQSKGSLSSARVIVPRITGLVHPQSVVDIGCGVGAWLSAFHETGCGDILGLDGPWVPQDKLLINPDHFVVVDLQHPPTLARTFDLAVSLEVGEHLPQSAARAFVYYLTGLAPCVLWSAAIPFQGGSAHINEQPPAFWFEFFAERDFVCFDFLRAELWNHEQVQWWYAQNILLYVHKSRMNEIAQATGTRPYVESPPPHYVHPERYLRLVTSVAYPEEIRPRKLISAAIKSARRRIRARIRRWGIGKKS